MADDAHPGEGIRKRFTLDTLGDLDDGLTRRLVDRALEAALDGVHKYLEQHLPSGMVLLRGHPGETNFHHFPL